MSQLNNETEFWEGMFGNAPTAKGGQYTISYKNFAERLEKHDKQVKIEEAKLYIKKASKLRGADFQSGINHAYIFAEERRADLEGSND